MTNHIREAYGPDLLRLPRLESPSPYYNRRLLSLPNISERGSPIVSLIEDSLSSKTLLLSQANLNRLFVQQPYYRQRLSFVVGDIGLFISGQDQVMIGRRRENDTWSLYPAIFELANKFTSLASGEKLNISKPKLPGDQTGALYLCNKDTKPLLSLSEMDIDKHPFALHLAEEMRDLSYLLDNVDETEALSPALAYWSWAEVMTPEMEADLIGLANYLSLLTPDHTVRIQLNPPRALQNGKTIWPNLEVLFGNKYMRQSPRGLRKLASDWANKLFHENHLATGAKEMTIFRRLRGNDYKSTPESVMFKSTQIPSNHGLLKAQARFGPLPSLSGNT